LPVEANATTEGLGRQRGVIAARSNRLSGENHRMSEPRDLSSDRLVTSNLAAEAARWSSDPTARKDDRDPPSGCGAAIAFSRFNLIVLPALSRDPATDDAIDRCAYPA
jgi:hypothetical protein